MKLNENRPSGTEDMEWTQNKRVNPMTFQVDHAPESEDPVHRFCTLSHGEEH